MSEERHAPLAVHPLQVEDGGELLKRGQIVRRTKIVVLIVLVLLALGAARTYYSRSQTAQKLQAGADERQLNYVKTAVASTSANAPTLALPGTLQGFAQSPIYARVGGYVKRWTKDIGATVRAGEVLAEIETPETDQQLSQAAAARNQAQASLELARSTAMRWEALRQKDVVSQQELDERRNASEQAAANLAATEANVLRLGQLQSFKKLVSPTGGVITRRNVDTGDLVDPGAAGGLARALFVVTQSDPLRLYVNVPQAYSQLVKVGQSVNVTQTELPGRVFKGQIVRNAASIDPSSRSLQVEVALGNKEGLLLPGAFVQVEFPLAPSRTLAIPNNALIIRGEGTQVAVVGEGSVVQIKPVKLGRNLGEKVEVLSGLNTGERMVLNPPDSLVKGDKVSFSAAQDDASSTPGKAADGGKKEKP
jgi:RND family efflux transporter MFP subunit